MSTHAIRDLANTDGDGRFHLDGLAAGKQPLRFQYRNVWVEKCVTVAAGTAVQVSATLDTTKGQ